MATRFTARRVLDFNEPGVSQAVVSCPAEYWSGSFNGSEAPPEIAEGGHNFEGPGQLRGNTAFSDGSGRSYNAEDDNFLNRNYALSWHCFWPEP
jgi:hypothetical protein